MLCKLCQKDKTLLKRSHIIPDFMYKGLYTDDHELFVISSDGTSQTRTVHTGVYESNILCRNCDNSIIGDCENYVHTILFGGTNLKEDKSLYYQFEKTFKDEKLWCFSNLDYALFKTFLLSIFWRMSISSRPNYLDISLGSHEETIRKMILDRNPFGENDYPCMIRSCINATQVPEHFIGPPHHSTVKPETPITIYIAGLFYRLYLSKSIRPGFHSSEAISHVGEIRILELPNEECKKYFEYFTGFKLA